MSEVPGLPTFLLGSEAARRVVRKGGERSYVCSSPLADRLGAARREPVAAPRDRVALAPASGVSNASGEVTLCRRGRLLSDHLAELLAGLGDGDALHTDVEHEMAADAADHVTHDESERLEVESRAARALDQRLAGDLRHHAVAGETSSAGYLRELGVVRGYRPRWSGGSWRRHKVGTDGRGKSWSRRSCR